ncbi:MAG: hypothetical protein J7502_10240 [Flavisolibacter sp.]|nr:hypothetical protein [Flavisolibacter sp.]
MRKSTIKRIESLGFSANSILITCSSGYSLLPIAIGTAQSQTQRLTGLSASIPQPLSKGNLFNIPQATPLFPASANSNTVV